MASTQVLLISISRAAVENPKLRIVHFAECKDEHVHALCHWEGECGQFGEELREWKTFLDYRQKKEMDRETEVQLKERHSAEGPTQVDLWREYRSYQQLEVENAKQWVEF